REFPEDMYSEAQLLELYLEQYPESREPAPPVVQLATLAPTPDSAPIPTAAPTPIVALPVAMPPPAPRYMLKVNARLAMLDQLTPLVAVTPGPDAPIALWLGEKLGAAMRAAHGLLTLAQLAAYVNSAGNRWYERVPGLGRARALRLVAWLWQHE